MRANQVKFFPLLPFYSDYVTQSDLSEYNLKYLNRLRALILQHHQCWHKPFILFVFLSTNLLYSEINYFN